MLVLFCMPHSVRAQVPVAPDAAPAGDVRIDEAQRKADEKIKATEDYLKSLKEKNARLAELANDADLKKEFAPFLAPGLFQPMDQNRFQGKDRVERPISYRLLQKKGGTTDVKLFVAVATSENDLKRPRWKKPTTKEEWEEAEKRLKLFNDLAPTWIEQGALAQ